MATYIWQHGDWPSWRFDAARLATPLARVRHDQGRLIGRMESLGFKLRDEAWLTTLTRDVVKTSQIEGQQLDSEQVRSSIARRLGLDIGALAPVDRHVDGIVEVMLDATRHYDHPLTGERLCAWHAALFPKGTLLGTFRRKPDERKADQGAQPLARWIRRQTHHRQVGQAGQVLPGHGLPRHPGPD